MDDAIEGAQNFTDLLRVGEHGPYVFTRMFSTEGWRARRRSKRTFKLLKRIDAPLREMLRPGERVFFITRGVAQPSLVEWYLLGAALYYLNQRAIVFTNRRILLLQIDWRSRPKEMRNEIAYAAIERFDNKLLGYAVISFRTGGRVRLAGVPRADRKWLAVTFDRLLAGLDAPPARSELEHLCPRCYAVADGDQPSCAACNRPFKSPKTAALLSLVYPGAGDLYLGHKGFAYLEIAGVTTIWLVLVLLAFDPATGLRDVLILFAVTVPLIHGFDAFTTYRIATKGLLTETGRSRTRRFVAAGVIPLLGLTAVAWTSPEKQRLRPDPVAVTGAQLPRSHRAALERAGYVQPGEDVRFFFSAGSTSVLQDGSLFTDQRVVSYEATYEGVWHESARFDEIVDLEVMRNESGEPYTFIYVIRADGVGFYLAVSTEAGSDRAFVEAITGQWRAARSAVPGPWFDGGSGASPEEAVILRGATDQVAVDSLQRWWLSVWYGQEGTDWTLLERLGTPADSLDLLTLEHAEGERAQVFFRTAATP